MARRAAHLGPGDPRGPHRTRWSAVAGESLPNLERPQHVRPHQAGLPHRHEPPTLTPPPRPIGACIHAQVSVEVGWVRRYTARPLTWSNQTAHGVSPLPWSAKKPSSKLA